jgi:hypothetical protein
MRIVPAARARSRVVPDGRLHATAAPAGSASARSRRREIIPSRVGGAPGRPQLPVQQCVRDRGEPGEVAIQSCDRAGVLDREGGEHRVGHEVALRVRIFALPA